ncbi:MAG: thioredoxin domain-containing protein [Sphingomonas sp.]|uniref:thioredoxin domain-containing protein n=1 Tax=Sphingomonas sp. TaxID=28214 RepID=UPI0017B37B17|nr:thioredoxin domain-containing protein [Sphingomonas sp.]MBA3667701.1 thioredoxin domain-containing protein [Sphingomonas sp.]
MKIPHLIIAASAILASAACNAEKGAKATGPGPEVTAKAVPAPNNGDWSAIVSKTAEGGFIMGNPNAKVKLVEYGSMTCPHCAAFDEAGTKPLIDNYVKKGLVSFEFRNYVRDQFDLTASLIARCGGESSFFGLTRNLYADQSNWIGKLQAADQAQMQALEAMAPAQKFSTIADLAGLKQFASLRGVPRAKADACLADEAAVNQLVQINSDAITQYPKFPGTPTFIINSAMVELGPVTEAQVWPTLETKIKEALAG